MVWVILSDGCQAQLLSHCLGRICVQNKNMSKTKHLLLMIMSWYWLPLRLGFWFFRLKIDQSCSQIFLFLRILQRPEKSFKNAILFSQLCCHGERELTILQPTSNFLRRDGEHKLESNILRSPY